MLNLGIAHSDSEMSRAIELLLAKQGRFQVSFRVGDGSRVVSAARDATPALVLLDGQINRPGAVEVTRQLAQLCPVLILDDKSSGSSGVVYDCMAAGAVDVVVCRYVDERRRVLEEKALLAKLKSLESVLLGARPRAAAVRASDRPRVVLIGSSTGGPQALQRVLSQLPSDLNAAIVIAQHVDEEFSGGLADWLRRETRTRVRLAVHGDMVEPNSVLIAGTNDHLVLDARRRLVYTPHPTSVPFRPSADALFASFAAHWPEPSVAALLTGMGRDGAQGLLALKQKHWHTIAQDAASCVVFGMPKAAIELGAAREILALDDIAPAITRACRTTAKRASG